ncbi:MAG TPA: GNAT family N-acetyltransferase [Acidimicrobiales bacterium]|nr:GNAT family N-acetyltransferase [Acidimicrobiales bacterium]
MLVVRALERGDIVGAVELIREGSLTLDVEHPEDVEAYWRAAVETRARRGDVLVADEDGAVVGVLQVMVFPHFQHAGGWCCELESVYVRADRRGHGIGTAMLGAAEALARDRGCYRIQLTSRNVRVDAHRFYSSNGYEQASLGFRKSLDRDLA